MKLSNLFRKMIFALMALSLTSNISEAATQSDLHTFTGTTGQQYVFLKRTNPVNLRERYAVYGLHCYLSYRLDRTDGTKWNYMSLRIGAYGDRHGFEGELTLPTDSVSVYRKIEIRYIAPDRTWTRVLGADLEAVDVRFVSDITSIETSAKPLTKRNVNYLGTTVIQGDGFVLRDASELTLDCVKEF